MEVQEKFHYSQAQAIEKPSGPDPLSPPIFERVSTTSSNFHAIFLHAVDTLKKPPIHISSPNLTILKHWLEKKKRRSHVLFLVPYKATLHSLSTRE